jgi:Fe-S oxidoreductase
MCPLSPSGWFSAARMVTIRNQESEIGGPASALGACLTCGSCEVRCPEGVHFTEFVRGLRSLTPVETKPACPHAGLVQSSARLMADDASIERDLSWVTDDLEVAEEGETALFVGCLPIFDILFESELGIRTIEIARSAIRLLNRLDIKPVLVTEERCCGHDLLWSGDQNGFEALAQANAAAFEARGVKHILTTCAECCRTWRLDIPRAAPGYRPRVEHLSEFLADRVDNGELVSNGSRTPAVTFQDPCRLGRHLEQTAAPRRVIETVLGGRGNGNGSLLEMQRSGRDAVCCGTAGFMHCDSNSRRLQAERLASASATGAEVLVTACPKCLIHFRCAQREDQRRWRDAVHIEIEDVTVLAAANLERRASEQSEEPREARGQKTGESR